MLDNPENATSGEVDQKQLDVAEQADESVAVTFEDVAVETGQG